VVDNKQLVGIVTRGDIVRAIVEPSMDPDRNQEQ
jgi:CBS domain-containing protein